MTDSDSTAHYLVFTLFRAKFALPLLWIREAIEHPDFLAKSTFSSRFFGMVQMGEETLPVIDLRPKLKRHFEQGSEALNPLMAYRPEMALACSIPWGQEAVPVALAIDRVQCLLSTDSPAADSVSMGTKKIPLLTPADLLTHEESRVALEILRTQKKKIA